MFLQYVCISLTETHYKKNMYFEISTIWFLICTGRDSKQVFGVQMLFGSDKTLHDICFHHTKL